MCWEGQEKVMERIREGKCKGEGRRVKRVGMVWEA